jgi:hypothetical protein
VMMELGKDGELTFENVVLEIWNSNF